MHFQALLTPFSHIFCKITFTSVNTKNRNWRKGHFELDIVAAKDNELIVIEVKTRSNTLFAEPEDAVDLPKIRRTVRAADTYIRLFQIDSPVRFDIITIVGDEINFKVEHIEEAFYPPLY